MKEGRKEGRKEKKEKKEKESNLLPFKDKSALQPTFPVHYIKGCIVIVCVLYGAI